MGEPHPIELRERVVKAYESGEGAYHVVLTPAPGGYTVDGLFQTGP